MTDVPPHGPGSAEVEKKAAAGNSVIAAILLALLKLVVGLLTQSLGILAEAAHSLLDFVAALVTFLAVRISDKPADHEHTYGHGKVENFSALIETVLLFVTCAWIIYEAIQRLFLKGVDVDPSLWAFLVMAVSIGVNVSRSRMLSRVARKHSSQALEADALHFSTDVWSSYVVIAGLAIVWLGKKVFPGQSAWLAKADAAAAVGVAIIILFVSYKLGKQTIDVLLDRAPEGLTQRFRDAAAAVDGVLSVGQLRVRRSGPRMFVDMSVDVDRNLSFERTHAIAEAVEARIEEISPGADAVIHTDPREVERESTARRIRAVAFRNQMSVHNISMHEEAGQMYIDLHLEVDDHLSLQQAHEMASHIERDLRKDMPDIAQIFTHLESRGTGMDEGKDVTAAERDIVARIKSVTDEIAGSGSCHNVIIRRYGSRLAVSLHCHFPEHLSIVEVHDQSSRIEERMKTRIPGVDRVLVHAEPRALART
jgi:cation diffusion facilitator family transporter